MQTVPMPEESELPSLYAKYYPRKTIDIQAMLRQVGDPASQHDRFRRWWLGTDNQGHYSAEPGMAVLDYGCGTGLSLLELEKLGAQAHGIEADSNVQQVVDALKLRIHIGSIDDMPFPTTQFDLIVMNQVLEHIPRPGELLQKLAVRLKPTGKLILAFPNAGSLSARCFGRRWINWHTPYHIHHFTLRSTKEFFQRHGWQILSVRTITPNLWTMLQVRAGVERTRMGVPHSMWTGGAAEPGALVAGNELAPPYWMRAAYALARRNDRLVRFAIAILNRIVDAIGRGDSFLITVVPKHTI
jgi:2-polyprenyl-3-methyl-5-hydroxy-6-metoxy-1,4-benzoquinol methylase